MNKELVKVILSEPFPCDDCSHKHRCGMDLMACKSFQYYVMDGKFKVDEPRTPTRSRYMRIFWGGKD